MGSSHTPHHLSISDSDDLYQIAILIDQLKHDDVQQRTAASKSITKIGAHICEMLALYIFLHEIILLCVTIFLARALGPERTRDELIPFLTGTIMFSV